MEGHVPRNRWVAARRAQCWPGPQRRQAALLHGTQVHRHRRPPGCRPRPARKRHPTPLTVGQQPRPLSPTCRGRAPRRPATAEIAIPLTLRSRRISARSSAPTTYTGSRPVVGLRPPTPWSVFRASTRQGWRPVEVPQPHADVQAVNRQEGRVAGTAQALSSGLLAQAGNEGVEGIGRDLVQPANVDGPDLP